MSALKEKYEKEIKQKLMSEFGIKNEAGVPKLLKIVVNMGTGVAKDDQKLLSSFREDLRVITGQHPVTSLAKKSEAGFKIKQGDPIGLKVTLRGEKMWGFLEKLINVALPRVRDFRGLPIDGFDKVGNYHLGLPEHIVFPEINPNKIDRVKGLGINIVSNAGDLKRGESLFRSLGFPVKVR